MCVICTSKNKDRRHRHEEWMSLSLSPNECV